jgi:hypothetical protein
MKLSNVSSIFVRISNLLGTAPLDGDHHGRLAIEQAFGYLWHNNLVYGLIGTINAFIFLRRESGGKLSMTRLLPATQANPTTLIMLYYFSHLSAITPQLKETHDDGRPIAVIRAPADSSRAPLVPPAQSGRPTRSTLPEIPLGGQPRRSPRFQDTPHTLHIDVRAPGTFLGCKGHKGMLSTGETVFAKLWDGWKFNGEEAAHENSVYKTLAHLQGTIVPRIIAYGGWGCFHIIVLEYIKVPNSFRIPIN